MALIALRGKYAVGEHAFTIVDDDMFEFLNQWKWKAKPNGKRNNVYAVRNVYDGKHRTIRMHRVVLGMDASDPLEVDHDNHNSLDNRRHNLIPATRSENALNARRVDMHGQCKYCSVPMSRSDVSAIAAQRAMVCCDCKVAAQRLKYAPHSSVFFFNCKQCGCAVTAQKHDRQFCSDRCRCRAKSARGYIPPARRGSGETTPRPNSVTHLNLTFSLGPPVGSEPTGTKTRRIPPKMNLRRLSEHRDG